MVHYFQSGGTRPRLTNTFIACYIFTFLCSLKKFIKQYLGSRHSTMNWVYRQTRHALYASGVKYANVENHWTVWYTSTNNYTL